MPKQERTMMVAKIYGNGVWRIIWEKDKELPFAVKHAQYDPLSGKWHTRTVVRYDTRQACLHHIADMMDGR